MGRSGMQHCSFYSREQDMLLFPIILTYRFCLMLQLCSRNTCNYSDYLFQTQHPKLKIFKEHPLSKVPGQVVENSSWSLSSTLQQLNLSFPNNIFREWHWKWCVLQVLEHAECLKMHTPHWHCWSILYLYVRVHSHTYLWYLEQVILKITPGFYSRTVLLYTLGTKTATEIKCISKVNYLTMPTEPSERLPLLQNF